MAHLTKTKSTMRLGILTLIAALLLPNLALPALAQATDDHDLSTEERALLELLRAPAAAQPANGRRAA